MKIMRLLPIGNHYRSRQMNKQETRQEIAEFLAEKVLGFHRHETFGHWCDAYNMNVLPKTNSKLEEFIYSPEGFFAVWNAVEKLPEVTFTQFINEPEYRVYIDTHDGTQIEGNGKDRYEAFYNAVMEAMK